MIKRTLLAAVVAASVATPALAVDFNGYFRAGTAISNNGTGDTSFEKQKVGRLGNENDNYSEIGLGKDLMNENGQKWRVETMIASGVSGSNGWEDGDFNIAQYNVQATGLLGFDKEATIWAGKRYYQRKDIHITDFYFLNTSGTGGGIENLSLGEQKLSVALMEDSASSQMTDGVSESVKGYIADIRLADIDLWQGATLELAGAYNFATGTTNGNTDTKADDGFLGTAIVNQNMANGFNQTVLQYGTSSYGAQMSTMGSGAYFDRSGDQNDATGFRVINHGVVSTGNFEVGHQLMYAKSTDSVNKGIKGDHEFYNAVVRPMYKWNKNLRTILEAGVFQETLQDDSEKKGSKITLAQAYAMDAGFFARPEIRFYGTYLNDKSDSAQLADKAKNTEFLVGVQVEAWF